MIDCAETNHKLKKEIFADILKNIDGKQVSINDIKCVKFYEIKDLMPYKYDKFYSKIYIYIKDDDNIVKKSVNFLFPFRDELDKIIGVAYEESKYKVVATYLSGWTGKEYPIESEWSTKFKYYVIIDT